MAANAATAAARGASLLVLVHIASRILTFGINQTLLRFLSPELLGVSAQLELYGATILYFARDSLRVAQQRNTNNTQAVVNVGYIPIFLGLPLAYGLSLLYSRKGLADVPYIEESLSIFGVAAIMELLVEPFYVACVRRTDYSTRARAQTLATIAKCFSVLGSVVYARKNGIILGVLPFALGQTVFSLILLTLFLISVIPAARREAFSIYPRFLQPQSKYLLSLFSRDTLSIWFNLYAQSGVKYLLTQGDSLVIARIASLHDQGVYAMAANYGGLIARILFQPIEDSARGFYAKSCAVLERSKAPSPEGMSGAARSLHTILRFYGIVGLAAWSIGMPLAPLLLELVAGRRWIEAGAGDVLASYCLYIPFLAVNGVTEAFVAAVASPKDLRFQSVLMVFYSVAFASAAYVGIETLQLGARGLILANVVNMGLRITWNISFIKSFFNRNTPAGIKLTDALPGVSTFAVAGAAVAAFQNRDKITMDALAPGLYSDLARDGALAMIFGVMLLATERDFLVNCYKSMRPATSTLSEKKKK